MWLWLPWECECDGDEPFDDDDELSELEPDDVDEDDEDVDVLEVSELPELPELLVDDELSELLDELLAPDFPRLSVL